MSKILAKIKKKINFQSSLNRQIEDIDYIFSQHKAFLVDEDIEELKKEKANLEKQIIKSKLSFDEKFKDFIYDFKDINESRDIEWLIQDMLPTQSIGVFYGNPGSGKSSFMIFSCEKLLKQDKDIYIFYIDADMSANKLKEIGIADVISKYKKRFVYAGKSAINLIEKTQSFLEEIVEVQKKYKMRKYLIIEDCLTLLSPKKNGFINTDILYKYEKKLREAGATVIVIHHLNKNGVFADSQQIENFADYTYLVERNDFNNCILLKPQKASRFEIKENNKLVGQMG